MTKRAEDDVPLDDALANSRDATTEGDPDEDPNTTGPGNNDEFVGRVQGQDEGYAGETGAERRAAAGES